MCWYVVEKLYEKFKELICGCCVDVEGMCEFVFNFDISDEGKKSLFAFISSIYIGNVMV